MISDTPFTCPECHEELLLCGDLVWCANGHQWQLAPAITRLPDGFPNGRCAA
jgi:hypothetical protein